MTNSGVLSAILASFKFVQYNFKKVLIFVSLILTINILSFTLSLITMSFPILGPSVFFLIFQGLGYALIHIITLIFYAKSSVSKITVTR